MTLREPYFLENLGQDQPYMSMLLISPSCDFSCEGCQNKHLKDNNTKEFSIKELTEEYIKNPFFKGITIAGLEPFLSGNDFLDSIIEFIQHNDIHNITIYTRFDKNSSIVKDFLNKLNRNIYLKYGKLNLKDNCKIVYFNDWSISILESQNFEKITIDKQN